MPTLMLFFYKCMMNYIPRHIVWFANFFFGSQTGQKVREPGPNWPGWFKVRVWG